MSQLARDPLNRGHTIANPFEEQQKKLLALKERAEESSDNEDYEEILIINKNLIYTFAMLNCFQIGAGAFQHSQKVAAPEFTGTTRVDDKVVGSVVFSKSFQQ